MKGKKSRLLAPELVPPLVADDGVPLVSFASGELSPEAHLDAVRSILGMLEPALAECKEAVGEADDDDIRGEFHRLLGDLADLSRRYPAKRAKAAKPKVH